VIARLLACVVAVALAVGAMAAPVSAQRQSGEPMKIQAEKHFNRALTLFKSKDFAGAAAEFARAYEIDERFDIMFAWAQAERLAGNCAKAVELYNKLREVPDLSDDDRRAILEGLERCDAVGRTEPEPEPEPEPVIKPAPPPPPVPEGSPWYSDPIGDALLVTGIIGVGVGGGLWLVSSLDASDAESATTYETHVALESRARERRILAIVSLGASAALLGGAVFRFLTRDDGSGDPATSAGVWATPDAAGVALGGSF
jgi:hypothetical protein